MTKVDKYIVGFFNGANELSPGIEVRVKEVGGFLAFNVVETRTDPVTEVDCTRTNGYAESVSNINGFARPQKRGYHQAKLVVQDLSLAEWVCPEV